MEQRHKWADVIIAMANGQEVEYRRDGEEKWWSAKVNGVDPFTDPQFNWRITPRTIKIGGIEVSEPIMKEPQRGARIFVPNPLAGNLFANLLWLPEVQQAPIIMQRGLVHLTADDAITHAKAMIIASGGRVE